MARTEKQQAASRANGCKSQGPKSSAGKAKVAANPAVHGLRSAAILLPGESAEAWEEHHKGILAALDPQGALEVELAGRVASLTWRLRRAASYEATSATTRKEDAEDALLAPASPEPLWEAAPGQRRLAQLRRDIGKVQARQSHFEGTAALFKALPSLPDDAPVESVAVAGLLCDLSADDLDPWIERLSAATDLPSKVWDDPASWFGWTAGHVRAALAVFAADAGLPANRLRSAAGAERASCEAGMVECVATLSAEHESLLARRLAQAAMPTTDMIELLCRYESHLSRELAKALDLLRQAQAARQGKPA